ALVDRGAGRLDRHHVRGETLGSELEARRGSGGRLEEQVDDRAPAERRQLLQLAPRRVVEAPRGREQPLDVLPRQVLDREQVPPRPRRREVVTHHSQLWHWRASSDSEISSTSSISSTSTRCTWTRSARAVGRFLPT